MCPCLGQSMNMLSPPLSNGPALRLARAHVLHKRFRPFVHPFVYRLFCLQARIDKPELLSKHNSWLFGVNRSRPVSLMNVDHGFRDGGDLMEWLKSTTDRAGVAMPGGAVWLQCFPRLLGYVFNPVSFGICTTKAMPCVSLLPKSTTRSVSIITMC